MAEGAVTRAFRWVFHSVKERPFEGLNVAL